MSAEIIKMLEKNRDENFEVRMKLAGLIGRIDACISLALEDLQHIDVLTGNLEAAIKLLTEAHAAVEARFKKQEHV
jgi:hypothetical protein